MIDLQVDYSHNKEVNDFRLKDFSLPESTLVSKPYCRVAADQRVLGIVPTSLLLPRLIEISAVSKEIVLGIVPARLFAGSVRFLETHVR